MTTKLQNANIDSNAVVSANITDSTLVNADFNASAALDISKFSGLAAEADGDRIYYNIALLGFKQAVSNSLNIFNLVNGIVDEFQDTSGVASSSGLTLNASDYYHNSGGGSGTLISATFTASSAPSKFRIVVFQENVGSPTLNTDIIASVSRDGSAYTTATLVDSGYVTGASGQRILTSNTDFSTTSGTSIKYKIVLANQESRIHGVSVQWN